MKKFSSIYLILLTLITFACDSHTKELTKFAKEFAEKALANQLDSLIPEYPELAKIDSISIPEYNPEDIKVIKNQDGIYSVKISPAVTLDVKYVDGKPRVVDSYGLFAYPENIYTFSKSLNLIDNGESDLSNFAMIQEKVIPYLNFTSPDLSFFNVKGHVKNMLWDNTPSYEFCATPWQVFWGWGGTYEFNEDGEWTNAKNFRMSPYTSIQSVTRNLENQIGKVYYPGDFGYDEDIAYKWENNILKSFQAPQSRGEFSYENNVITKIEYQYSNTEFMVPGNIVMSDFEFDEMGNWVSCKYVKTTKENSKRMSGEIIRKIEYYPIQ